MTDREWEQGTTSARDDAVIAALAESLRAAGERPEGFWHMQRTAIQERIQGAERRTSLRMAWAGSMALISVAVGLLAQSPAPASAMAISDPDHDLLVGVEQAVRRPVPQALEPAQLLAQEIERSVEAAAKSGSQ
ncbi:MAG: hypothetical protein ACRD24_03465 [Terriglobales bacterium]